MFVSFFPKPRIFFWSAVAWAAVCIAGWYAFGRDLGPALGFLPGPGEPLPIGVSRFWSGPFLWFYLYYLAVVAVFAAAWRIIAPHPWASWSVLGSALILFTTYFQVQVSVTINAWYGPFFDLIQVALARSRPVTTGEFYSGIAQFLSIALVYVTVAVLTLFFANHYVFRWRNAMNDYYMSHWPRLRLVEGASQRVQEDTMRFARITERLGVELLESIMTLIAFLPVLVALSAGITEVPLIGDVPQPLVVATVLWSVFGTLFLAAVGIKLPGLEFRNQRVEAALRKELVYGEDDPRRADERTTRHLFDNVRRNYFRLFFHYMYFQVARIFFLQIDNIFGYLVLAPSIVAGAITLGLMQQILNALQQVRTSFQYLVYSWTTVVELLSIYKRLRAFEAVIHGEALPQIDRDFEVRLRYRRSPGGGVIDYARQPGANAGGPRAGRVIQSSARERREQQRQRDRHDHRADRIPGEGDAAPLHARRPAGRSRRASARRWRRRSSSGGRRSPRRWWPANRRPPARARPRGATIARTARMPSFPLHAIHRPAEANLH